MNLVLIAQVVEINLFTLKKHLKFMYLIHFLMNQKLFWCQLLLQI